MGAGVRAVVQTGRVAVGQPWVAAATVITGVLAPVFAVLTGAIPFVGGLVYALVVHPILLAGLLHVSSTAVDQPVGLGSYLAGVRTHYFGLLRALVLVFVVYVPLVWLATLVVFVVGFTGAVELTAGILFALAVFTVMGIGLQFVDASVVVDGDGARGAVEHSWEALAHHPLSVLGYTSVRLVSLAVLAGAVGVFGRGSSLVVGSGTAPGTTTLAAALGLGLLGYLVGGVFHAVFYREVSV
jgi:hypothetical protein